MLFFILKIWTVLDLLLTFILKTGKPHFFLVFPEAAMIIIQHFHIILSEPAFWSLLVILKFHLILLLV
jgi:hypothetical protein